MVLLTLEGVSAVALAVHRYNLLLLMLSCERITATRYNTVRCERASENEGTGECEAV